VPAHTGSEYAYSSGDSHLWKKHEPNKKPICTQIYFQNDRDAHHSNRVEWSVRGMEMGFGMGMGLGMGTGNWTPDADKSLGCRRLSAPAGPRSQHFKSKLRMAKPGMGISTRGLQKSRSPEVPKSPARSSIGITR